MTHQEFHIDHERYGESEEERVGSDWFELHGDRVKACLLYTSPSPRDRTRSRMPSSA